jgi:hypothetical protein
MMIELLRHTRIAGLMGLAFALAGCADSSNGPRLYGVTGEVTYDGQPIEKGAIKFTNSGDGRAYTGEINNGRYELKCEPGKAKVEITASRVIPGKFTEANPGEKEPAREMYIPAKYNAKTTLEADVEDKSNEIPFHLKK